MLAVDEPIYRRLPCFLIATVDKFASLPWVGHVGALLGHVDRHDSAGFYGPCDPISWAAPVALMFSGRLTSASGLLSPLSAPPEMEAEACPTVAAP